jgi:hypothetical protein
MPEQITILIQLFIIILLGAAAQRSRLLTDGFNHSVNRFLFNVALPILIFTAIAGASLADLSEAPQFLLINVIINGVAYLGLFLLLRRTGLKHKQRSALLINSLSGNNAYLAFPLILAIFGQSYFQYAVLYVLVFSISLIFFGLFFIQLDRDDEGFNLGKSLKRVLFTPITFSAIIGALFLLTGLQIPGWFDSSVGVIGDLASPLALFVIGSYLAEHFSLQKLNLAITASVFKLIILPAFAFAVVYLTGVLSEIPAAVSVIQAAMPTGLTVLAIGDEYELDLDIIASGIIISTAIFAPLSILLLLIF